MGSNDMIASASNDSIGFSFYIKSFTRNSRESSGRYRQTTNVDNQWKVNLKKSGEGAGDITTFWLSGYDNTQVSPDMKVKQGSGAKYSSAYKSASQRTIYLSGENNNVAIDGYQVSGVWDEETN